VTGHRPAPALLGLQREAGHGLPSLDKWMVQRAMIQPS
jgi:hypothetical protein